MSWTVAGCVHRAVCRLQDGLVYDRLVAGHGAADSPPREGLTGELHGGLRVDPSWLESLAAEAFRRLQFQYHPAFLRELQTMAANPANSSLERLACSQLADNLLCAAEGLYPACQDSGTASIFAWKGQNLRVASDDYDDQHFQRGMLASWQAHHLRNSQILAKDCYDECNSGTNAPLLSKIIAAPGDQYRMVFIAKGGGSSNKTRLFQETKRLLSPQAMRSFLERQLEELGVSACPPYSLAVVIGGQSPEQCIELTKLASLGALDALPLGPDGSGQPFRDPELEALLMRLAEDSGWGAQFGGRAMARSARVIRLPRHAASLPIGLGLSCVAHRQIHAYISREGVFLERLASDVEEPVTATASDLARPVTAAASNLARLVTTAASDAEGPVSAGDAGRGYPSVDLSDTQGLQNLRAGQLVLLSGTVALARDAVHARLSQLLDAGGEAPAWARLPVYYGGPTEAPEGAAIGSLGPTTARRMDGYCTGLLSRGLFRVMIGKGERSEACRQACARHGGVYLAAVGGAAARTAARHVRSARLLDWPELGMEAVRQVELQDLPAMVIIDSLGNDFYSNCGQHGR